MTLCCLTLHLDAKNGIHHNGKRFAAADVLGDNWNTPSYIDDSRFAEVNILHMLEHNIRKY
jgi:hypothetical protein